MTQPIGEFLMAHYSGYLNPEENHPQFKKAMKGRPRQIDYVLLSKEKKILDFAVECKWIGITQPTRQSIIDDIMRLECLRRPARTKGSAGRFFIFAGRKSAVEKFLRGRLNKSGMKPPPMFISGFAPTQHSTTLCKINIEKSQVCHRRFFYEFGRGYKRPLPVSYRARLVANEAGDDVRVVVWKIGSMGKRTTFKRSQKWLRG